MNQAVDFQLYTNRRAIQFFPLSSCNRHLLNLINALCFRSFLLLSKSKWSAKLAKSQFDYRVSLKVSLIKRVIYFSSETLLNVKARSYFHGWSRWFKITNTNTRKTATRYVGCFCWMKAVPEVQSAYDICLRSFFLRWRTIQWRIRCVALATTKNYRKHINKRTFHFAPRWKKCETKTKTVSLS